ncbi:Uncharacterised protein [Escherichia coli]|uniref:Uncharacterized protein n=1 Tax=Escherichia coli TaxID=562 RepID=A0A2X1NDF3_ECOLX|nr:Uncharacterised protein [Escherichia coli]
MTPRLFFALAIFLGSYLPLSMILLMQDLDNKKLKGNICFNFFDFRNMPSSTSKTIPISEFVSCLFSLLYFFMVCFEPC